MEFHEKVSIARNFQQSTRIDSDLDSGAEALDGFVIHNSAKSALHSMTRMIVESKQRAFTFTGPYGVGKSSLALMLCASVSKTSISNQTKTALARKLPYFNEAFPSDKSNWLVIPLVGHKGSLLNDLRKKLCQRKRQKKIETTGRDIIKTLKKKAEERPEDGVLLVIDEMGKYLEGATEQGGDIHFFQELAESATRTKGRLVILGILHQSFEQYASRLGSKVREEWAKVQGRYVDIPLVTAVEEVVDLISKAINTDLSHPESFSTARLIADSIRRRRNGIPSGLEKRLDACWPIHPATAVLLGPLSRWRFGQNERSVFGFLGSSEPEGFQDFLKSNQVSNTMYEPWRLWDYIRINLESAIMASPDIHKWTQSVESVELCEAKGTSLHIKLAKTIAVIEMFRHRSGLMPETEVLETCITNAKRNQTKKALKDIRKWSGVIFRKHFNSWAIYAGSDFDIENSIKKELASKKTDIEQLSDLAQMHPVIAKRHYHETGNMRWFRIEIVSDEGACEAVKNFYPVDGMAGVFFLVISSGFNRNIKEIEIICRKASSMSVTSDYPITVGGTFNSKDIVDLSKELSALEDIRRNSPELEGDSIARREIEARTTTIKTQLQDILEISLNEARWFIKGRKQRTSSLSTLASKLADETFKYAPKIHTELVNREKPSSNGQAAIRKLLYKMVSSPDQQNLGIDGFPPELGIYKSVLEDLKLHGKTKNDSYEFTEPSAHNKKNKEIFHLWKKAKEILRENRVVPISEIYNYWTSPPFGVRRGLLPVLGMAFIMTNRSSVAVYSENVFQTEINDLVVDLLLQKNSTIQLRWIDLGDHNKKLFESLWSVARQINEASVPKNPLETARVLVHFVFKLPTWTRRTSSISDEAQKVRNILLSASDPIQTLFVDLPLVFRSIEVSLDDNFYEDFEIFIKQALQELKDAYTKMLSRLCQDMFEVLGHKDLDMKNLRRRAEVVRGITGDFRLEAFARRLREFSNPQKDMEPIASFALNKPVHDWSDNDPAAAMFEIAGFALKFRQAETLAQVKKSKPTSEAVALIVGIGENDNTIIETFDITEDEKKRVTRLAKEIKLFLDKNGNNNKQKIAAIAEVLKSMNQKTISNT